MDDHEFRQWHRYIQAAATERALLTQLGALTILPPSPDRTELLSCWAEHWNSLVGKQVTVADLEAPD